MSIYKRLLQFLGFSAITLFFAAQASATSSVDISGVRATAQKTTATISWATDVTATGTLQYGTASGVYTKTAQTDSDTLHTVYLSDLTPGTTYYFLIAADATDGSTGSTEEQMFTTYSNAPQLVSSEIVTRTGDKIVMKTTTNTYAKVTVKYGTSAADLSSTSTSADFTMGAIGCGQEVNYNLLKNLKPATTYYYTITLYPLNTSCDEDTSAAVVSGVKSVKTTGLPLITDISPKTGKSGTRVTISGQNFGEGLSKGHNPVDAVVAFGCPLTSWARARGGTIKCLGWIESWSDTKIVARTLKTTVTGQVYIGKSFMGDTLGSGGWSYLKMFVVKGPKFTKK